MENDVQSQWVTSVSFTRVAYKAPVRWTTAPSHAKHLSVEGTRRIESSEIDDVDQGNDHDQDTVSDEPSFRVSEDSILSMEDRMLKNSSGSIFVQTDLLIVRGHQAGTLAMSSQSGLSWGPEWVSLEMRKSRVSSCMIHCSSATSTRFIWKHPLQRSDHLNPRNLKRYLQHDHVPVYCITYSYCIFTACACSSTKGMRWEFTQLRISIKIKEKYLKTKKKNKKKNKKCMTNFPTVDRTMNFFSLYEQIRRRGSEHQKLATSIRITCRQLYSVRPQYSTVHAVLYV